MVEIPVGALEAIVGETEKLLWAIVELGSHCHDCEELLSPQTRRILAEACEILADRFVA